MRRNVTELVEKNASRSEPLAITIGLRPDRPLEEVLAHPDFQPILAHSPELDFTWAFTSANGRITRDQLPDAMKLRVVRSRREACVNLYNGPIVLPDGTVMACSCVAAMDALSDLGIGNVLENGLHDLWTGEKAQRLRNSFSTGSLNPTCAGCDMYRNLELYRTQEGRRRADLNRARFEGRAVRTNPLTSGPFAGG
jgi:radical SAM protein with 4Fe4S-binding SPASM domain